jgi:DNA-binding NarL/FixJ family response regulator
LTVAPFGTGTTQLVVIIELASRAGMPPIITFVEPITAGATTVRHGTNAGVPGVGRFGQPTIGEPATSAIVSAGAPPTFTTICFGIAFTMPAWWGHVITAFALQIGGTLFPSYWGGRSIARGPRLGNPADSVKLFVLDPHTIYRRGLVASLELMSEVERVEHGATVADAHDSGALPDADLVILDPAAAGAAEFIGSTEARVMVCSSDLTEESVLSALQAGAVGYLRKDTLTTETLAAAVRAAANGTGVMEAELLGNLLKGLSPESLDPARPAVARLTDREQQVLALIAAGHPTREVAQQLCYSERTVKNVLHDVVTKLNARSRSQAVAFAVREGLI